MVHLWLLMDGEVKPCLKHFNLNFSLDFTSQFWTIVASFGITEKVPGFFSWLALKLCMYLYSFWNDCSSFIFSNPVSARGYTKNDLTKANNEVTLRHVYSALIDQKDDGMRKMDARNSIPPLAFEEKIQLDYRSDGFPLFCRGLPPQASSPSGVWLFQGVLQFIFAVDNGYKGFGCV